MAGKDLPRVQDLQPADGKVVQFVDGDGQPRPASLLTGRQREVGRLIAQGMSDAEIAELLVLPPEAIADDVAGIVDRLGLESRAQVGAWSVESGLCGGQDRLLTVLERLLDVQPTTLKAAMDEAATLIAEELGTEKVDAFLHDPTSDTLVAVGASETPLGRRQAAVGLNRQQIANGGRAVHIFLTGTPHLDGSVDKDEEELPGVRRVLNVRSQIGVPLEVGGVRRGALTAQSTEPEFFSQRDLRFLQAVSRWVGNVAHSSELAERNAAAAIEEGRRLAAEELVTVLAHDLRNHLAPISGRAQFLLRRALRERHTANVGDAQELNRAVDRLKRLISELLDVARIDQGLFDVRPELVDLATLAREAAAAVQLPGKTIQVEAPPELALMGDPARVRQAIENLLANAVQHAPDDTTVRLVACRSERDGKPQATIQVIDQGPGIDPVLLPRLFDRFARSSRSGGLGIGLYLVRQIAEAHHGGVDIRSAPGAGTEFTLVLPAETS
jgi:two-component system, OmpR family, sensor kinase